MNAGSIFIVTVIVVLFVLALRRVWKKGAPCECGGNKKMCGGGSKCTCCK